MWLVLNDITCLTDTSFVKGVVGRQGYKMQTQQLLYNSWHFWCISGPVYVKGGQLSKVSCILHVICHKQKGLELNTYMPPMIAGHNHTTSLHAAWVNHTCHWLDKQLSTGNAAKNIIATVKFNTPIGKEQQPHTYVQLRIKLSMHYTQVLTDYLFRLHSGQLMNY